MTLRYIGPIAVSFHGDPTFDWDAPTTPSGFEPLTIGGYLEWGQAQQLKELVNNRHRRITIAGVTGVPEIIWADDTLLAATNGWYLLVDCRVPATQPDSLGDAPCPFSLAAVYLGADRQPIVVRSARPRANSYGIVPKSVVTDPLGLDGSFVFSPGGTHVTREFDPEPHDSARVAVISATQHSYIGAVTATSDALDLVIPLAMEMA